MMYTYLILCVLSPLSAVTQSSVVKQDTGVKTVNVGDSVILHCYPESQVAMHFSWYRQSIGGRPELLSNVYKYDTPARMFHWLEKNPRFSVQRQEGMNHLHISGVQPDDSGFYFCGISHSNMVEFGEGVFLSVRGDNFKAVVQEPVSESTQPGKSVTFNCSVKTGNCNAECGVYWFKRASHQGIVYIHSDQCKHAPPSASSSQSCVYHLEKTNVSSSDAGTYYCAVASCGAIMFGNGTKLQINDDGNPATAIKILVWLSIIRTGTLLLFLTVCPLLFMKKNRYKS